MSNKTYPPKFNKNIEYPAIYNLDEIEVHPNYSNEPEGKWFNVTGLPSEISYGKHYFLISFNDSTDNIKLKQGSPILFEFKDANGLVIFSNLTKAKTISGAAVGYMWVKQDPLRTYEEIAEGQGTMTIVAELQGLGSEWMGIYNIKTTISINIKKNLTNLSPVLFKDSASLLSNTKIYNTLEYNSDNMTMQTSYANFSCSKLDVYGGKLNLIEIYYMLSGSSGASGSQYPTEFQFCGAHVFGDTYAFPKYEDGIDTDYARGLNPVSEQFKIPMPNIPHQSSSTFGVDEAKVKFRLKYRSANGAFVQDLITAQDVTVTTGFGSFDGPPVIIGGDGNLMGGQIFLGGITGSGIEFMAGSAYIRSVGYRGFEYATTSASAGAGAEAGLGPGFMIWSGSLIPGLNSSEYGHEGHGGGVGFEMVADSESYFKFRTGWKIPASFGTTIYDQKSSLDIRASQFYVGTARDKIGGQFISGANGQIEISSSNFHLQPDGDLRLSGFISASAGQIGAWKIGSSAEGGWLSGSHLTLNAKGSAMYKSDTPPGTTHGYFIDFTPSGSEGNIQTGVHDYYVQFGPNFAISRSGLLIASGAKIEGTLVARAGYIGGFSITSHSLSHESQQFFISGAAEPDGVDSRQSMFISSSNFNVKGSGDITGSRVLFTGGKIGDFNITHESISDAGGDLILHSTGVITGSKVHFDGGTIAGWVIKESFISSSTDLGAGITLDSANRWIKIFGDDFKHKIQLGRHSSGYGIFGFDSSENIIFKLGEEGNEIAGWGFDQNQISGGNISIHKSGRIETMDFQSGIRGWRIDSTNNGSAEFENVRIRGTLSTTVFEKESINAVGGQLYVANATTITGSGVSVTDTTMSVANASGFIPGEILAIKKFHALGFSTEYVKVDSSSMNSLIDSSELGGNLYVTRSYGSNLTEESSSFMGQSASSATAYSASQVLVSTGHWQGSNYVMGSDGEFYLANTGSGFIRLNANPSDPYAPYIDIVERTGSGVYDVDLKARLGDLSGISQEQTDNRPAGFGLFSDNVFLKGHIEAKTGNIGKVGMASGSITMGTEGWIEGWINHPMMVEGGHSAIDSTGFVSSQSAAVGGDLYTKGFFLGFDTASSPDMSAENRPPWNNSGIEAFKFGIYGGEINSPRFLTFDGQDLHLVGTISTAAGDIGGWTVSSESLYRVQPGIAYGSGPGIVFHISSSWLHQIGQTAGSHIQLSASRIDLGENVGAHYLPVATIHGKGGQVMAAMGHFQSESIGLFGISGLIGSWDLSENSMSKYGAPEHEKGTYWPKHWSNWTASAGGDHIHNGVNLTTQSRYMALGDDEGPILTKPIVRPGQPQVYGEPYNWVYNPSQQGWDLSWPHHVPPQYRHGYDSGTNDEPKTQYYSADYAEDSWPNNYEGSPGHKAILSNADNETILGYMPNDYFFFPITHSKYFKVTWDGDCEVGDDLSVGEWIKHLNDTGSGPQYDAWKAYVEAGPGGTVIYPPSGSFLNTRFGADSGSFFKPHKIYSGIQFPNDEYEVDFMVGGMDVMELKGVSRGITNEESYSLAFMEKTGSCNWNLNGKNWDTPYVQFGFPIGAPPSQSMYISYDEIRMMPGQPAASPGSATSYTSDGGGGWNPDQQEGRIQMYAKLEMISHSIEAWAGDKDYPGYAFDGDRNTGMFLGFDWTGEPAGNAGDPEKVLSFTTNGELNLQMYDNHKNLFHNTAGDSTILLDGDEEGAGRLTLFDDINPFVDGSSTDGRIRLTANNSQNEAKIEMHNIQSFETVQISANSDDEGDGGSIKLWTPYAPEENGDLNDVKVIDLHAAAHHIEMQNRHGEQVILFDSDKGNPERGGAIYLLDQVVYDENVLADIGDTPLIALEGHNQKIIMHSHDGIKACLDADDFENLDDYATVEINADKGGEKAGKIRLRDKDQTDIIELDADTRKIQMQNGHSNETVVINADSGDAGKITLKSDYDNDHSADMIVISCKDKIAEIEMYNDIESGGDFGRTVKIEGGGDDGGDGRLRLYNVDSSGYTLFDLNAQNQTFTVGEASKNVASTFNGTVGITGLTTVHSLSCTNTATFGSLSDGSITITAFSSTTSLGTSDTLIPTQNAVKTYVDALVTEQDLDFKGDDDTALTIDLDSEVLDIAGGTNITTAGSGNVLTINVDDAFLINDGNDTTSGTITAGGFSGNLAGNVTGTVDGIVGGTTPAAVTGTVITANTNFAGNITGDLTGTADYVTTNANLTGDITSAGNATVIAGGVIVNADVNASAAIEYSKMGTIPTWDQHTTGKAATAGNADTVTGATFTTALTVNTGTVTLTGAAANTSALTIGAGAVSVEGANTGDQTVAYANAIPFITALLGGIMSDTNAIKFEGIAAGATATDAPEYPSGSPIADMTATVGGLMNSTHAAKFEGIADNATATAAPEYESGSPIADMTATVGGLMNSTHAAKFEGIEDSATADQDISGIATNGLAIGVNETAIGLNTAVAHSAHSYSPIWNSTSTGTLQATTIRATADVIAYYSDERLKNFEGTIPNALDKILTLNGYYFRGNEVAKTLGFDNQDRQVGLSAQEVEKVLPEVVKDAPIDKKYKTLQYEKMIPLLIEGMKEQQEQINRLEEELNKLKDNI